MHTFCEHIRYVGAEDDNIDLFEAQYPVPAGISYNSYLIDDKAPAIVDAVDMRRCGDWLDAVAEALGEGRQPAYLIVQHMEPDHSGSIEALLRRYPDTRVVSTQKGAAMLHNFFEDIDFASKSIVVKDGDTLSLGRTELTFITAPMVHWPEVMMTLDSTDGVLFSADAFGSFALSGSTEAWDAEARRYYTNIVGRYGASVQAVMEKLKKTSFSVIAPLHGPALTDDLSHYWHLYDKWSRYEPEARGVLVAYASIYGGTAEAARRLAAKLEAEDAGEIVLIDLCRHDVSYAVAEAFRLSGIVLCSVTFDGGLFPAMQNFLHHIESKKLSHRRVGLVENGSWAPVAARIMTEELARMTDMTVVEPVVTIHSRLHHSDLPGLRALAKAMAGDGL